MNKSSLKFFQKFNLQNKSLRKISMNKSSKRKNLHFSKEKSPKPYSKGKISNEQIFNKNFQNFNRKISKNKSLRKNLHEQIFINYIFKSLISRINLQGKISTNKSSKRKNLHFSKEKSPKPYSKGKISRINLQGKISTNKSSKEKISNE